MPMSRTLKIREQQQKMIEQQYKIWKKEYVILNQRTEDGDNNDTIQEELLKTQGTAFIKSHSFKTANIVELQLNKLTALTVKRKAEKTHIMNLREDP